MVTERTYNFLFDNKDYFSQEHHGRWVVFKDAKVLAVYSSEAATRVNAPKYGSNLLIIHFADSGMKELVIE